jgi:hypothetical protein
MVRPAPAASQVRTCSAGSVLVRSPFFAGVGRGRPRGSADGDAQRGPAAPGPDDRLVGGLMRRCFGRRAENLRRFEPAPYAEARRPIDRRAGEPDVIINRVPAHPAFVPLCSRQKTGDPTNVPR